MPTTTIFHTTQLISLTTSLFLSGINFGASHLTLPILHRLDAQTVSPAAIASLYHRGARLVLPFAILSTLASALVAVQSSGHERTKWVVAAVFTFMSLPFSRVIWRETSDAQWKFAGGQRDAEETQSLKSGQDEDQDKEVLKLLKRWKRMNLVRSILALAGGLVAATTVVCRG
ncbi:hypothetical protein SUNI508_05985 [Seiridium unicorne]|uniref:DUF1772-domain-containing protein n=1 Tax=Seiridium unicorne TaxID=138068 RepID=A0ABR2V2P5_9PEZI